MASASPRRAELIKSVPWLNATVFPSCVTEPEFAGGSVHDYVCKLAKLKATDVLGRVGGTVIGADTVVYACGKILGKPKSAAEAEDMFKLLCGRTHEVITGYCVINNERFICNAVTTLVSFGEYNDNADTIKKYIQSGAPFDKAGGYGIQDAALAPLIKKTEGDLNNVIGLPVDALTKTLRSFFQWQ